MTKLTKPRSSFNAGAHRPKTSPCRAERAGRCGGEMAVTKMIEHGWLQEVDANLRRGEPLGAKLAMATAPRWCHRRGLLPSGSSLPCTGCSRPKRAGDTTSTAQPIQRAGTKQRCYRTIASAEGTMDTIWPATGCRRIRCACHVGGWARIWD